jgi:hypothetical protein
VKKAIESLQIGFEILIGWILLMHQPVLQLTGGIMTYTYHSKMDEPIKLLHNDKKKTKGKKKNEEAAHLQIKIQNGIKESPRKVRAGPVIHDLQIKEGGGGL